MVDAYDLIIVATVLIGTIENSSKPLKFPMPWPFGAKVILKVILKRNNGQVG